MPISLLSGNILGALFCNVAPALVAGVWRSRNTGFRLCDMIIARNPQLRKGLTPLLLCAGWFIGRGVKHGISGASGECGAVHLFNVPSMTTGDRENSRVFSSFFRQYCRNSIEREEPYAAVLSVTGAKDG